MPEKRQSKTLKYLKTNLRPFLRNNTNSKIEEVKGNYFITNPWNDKSLIFILFPRKRSKLINALNQLVLPPQYSAIFHLDTNTMEFIYDRLKPDDPILSREFMFNLEKGQYKCNYKIASDRLMELVEYSARAQDTSTDFRNLIKIQESQYEVGDFSEKLVPVSFYISGFAKFDDDEIEEVSKYLNFYMLYYDRKSPYILMHKSVGNSEEFPTQDFLEGGFPNTISTKRKDPMLLDLMLAACQVGNRLQFIHCYQLLEYAAFYFVDDEVKRELTHILAAPDIFSNPDKYISRVLETTSEIKQDDEVKLQKLILHTCKPQILFKEINSNKSYFMNKQKFEGGFELEPLISEGFSLDNFKTEWHPKILNNLKYIRNALVHGREKRYGRVISPTDRNDELISPWCCIARRIAEQVVLFG